MKRKSVFDRYTLDQLQRFKSKYLWSKEHLENNWPRAAAGSAIDTLCNLKEWNGANGSAYFDDALAIAARIDNGFMKEI